MKKSLLFVAAMFAAVGANAQGLWTNLYGEVEKDAIVFTAGTVVSDKIENLSITFAGATDWKSVPADGTFTANGVEYSSGYVQGNTNGMAAGLEHSSGQSSHIQLVPAVAGTIYVAAKFGNNKPIWAAKVANAEIEDLDDSDMSAYLYTYEGKYIKDDGTYGGDEAATEAVFSALPLAVEPGNTYFFWVSGSKLMLCGINFVAGGTGIENVKAAKNNAEGVAYNLAGQKVSNSFKGIVIKNGVKMIQK